MAVSFKRDIAPLFTPEDIECMVPRGVDLNKYGYMADAAGDQSFPDHAHANHVYARVTGEEQPQMPLGGDPWTPEMCKTFKQWMEDGYQP